jgi:hypothetical protein
LLTGKILICLVQTDDNYYECPGIGCSAANWNDREHSSNRGITGVSVIGGASRRRP